MHKKTDGRGALRGRVSQHHTSFTEASQLQPGVEDGRTPTEVVAA